MKQLKQRNNTSYPKQVLEALKSIKRDEKDPLRYHQRIVVDYFLDAPVRGMLIYHKMGAGKTMIGVGVCEALIAKYTESPDEKRNIIFISAKSLHANFKKDIVKYHDATKTKLTPHELEKHIDKNYQFVSLNASNMLTQVYKTVESDIDEVQADDDELAGNLSKLGDLEGTIIVIDEAHNFFNSIANGSKNASGLYRLMLNAKDIKILYLTGSPITNDPFEIALCYNTLAGPMSKSNKRATAATSDTLFGEDYLDFVKYFVGVEAIGAVNPNADDESSKSEQKIIHTIKRKDKFMNRIVGLTSYFGADDPEQMKLFPRKYDDIIEKIPMSIPQYIQYITARDIEREENSRKAKFGNKRVPLQKPKGASSSYRVRSRQLSNFMYPKYAISVREQGMLRIQEKHLDRIKAEDLIIKSGVGDDIGLETYSPKLTKLLYNIQRHLPFKFITRAEAKSKQSAKTTKTTKTTKKKGGENSNEQIGSGVVYSQFIGSGVGLIGNILRAHGFKEIASINDALSHKSGPSYALISGDVDPDTRAEIIKIFNSDDNLRGEKLSILLITATGAEGIDLQNARHIHVLEPYWHWARIAQVIARVVRAGSHMRLPEKERTVQPYIYLSDYPPSEQIASIDGEAGPSKDDMQNMSSIEDTTDVYLYHKSVQNQVLIDSFLRAIQESSIDCVIHNKSSGTNLSCNICSPTNEALFYDDIHKDMGTRSKCQPLKEQSVKADSIIIEIDGKRHEYHYTMSDNGPVIFEYNKILNGHEQIYEDHPMYDDIIAAIRPKKKK